MGAADDQILVIGVGNPYRHDDGVGVQVIERLRDQASPGVEPVEETGEPVALINRWADRAFVIMVDAVTSGSAAGTVGRIECADGRWDLGARPSSASTHGLGVAEAVELGRVLERLPRRLVILGVETQDVSNGVGLSAPVATAVADVLVAIDREVQSWSATTATVSPAAASAGSSTEAPAAEASAVSSAAAPAESSQGGR